MSNPTNGQVVTAAINIWKTKPKYSDMDCQRFVEQCVIDAGGYMDYLGSNDMARNAVVWMGTIENAKAEGKLRPGAGLMIHDDDETNLPARYKGDGLGDFNHVGFYIGDGNAVLDKAKNSIFNRKCNVIHSSSSMGRVAGSTLQNGWTHVVWFKEIDYGVTVNPGVTLGVDASEEQAIETEGITTTMPIGTATVWAANGKPVKLRANPSTKCKTYWTREVGETVDVLETGDVWCKIRSRTRVGYMMTDFLHFG